MLQPKLDSNAHAAMPYVSRYLLAGTEYECPDFMTMCDNHPERMSSPSYCVWSPDYKCYHMGWPSCCSAPGGDIMNCPRDEHPPCESNAATARGVAANDIVKFLRGN